MLVWIVVQNFTIKEKRLIFLSTEEIIPKTYLRSLRNNTPILSSVRVKGLHGKWGGDRKGEQESRARPVDNGKCCRIEDRCGVRNGCI